MDIELDKRYHLARLNNKGGMLFIFEINRSKYFYLSNVHLICFLAVAKTWATVCSPSGMSASAPRVADLEATNKGSDSRMIPASIISSTWE